MTQLLGPAQPSTYYDAGGDAWGGQNQMAWLSAGYIATENGSIKELHLKVPTFLWGDGAMVAVYDGSTRVLLGSVLIPSNATPGADNVYVGVLGTPITVVQGQPYFLTVTTWNGITYLAWNESTPNWAVNRQDGANPLPDPLPAGTNSPLREFYIAAVGDAAATSPTITNVSPTRNTESFTITGTEFGDVQGTVSIGGYAQVVTSWTPTSIVCTCGRGVQQKYGSYDVLVTAADAQTASAPTTLLPATNYAYVDLVAPLAPSANRLTATPTDLAAGNQIEYLATNGVQNVQVYSDGSFVADGTVSAFTAKAWNSADGWGSNAVQTISVTTPVAPTITTTTLGTLTTGTSYSLQLVATGSAPISWSRFAGTIPAGLTLSETGLLSGKPVAPGADYNFTVEAANSEGADTQVYTGYVGEWPSFTGESIPTLRVGVPYSGYIEHAGWPDPTFSVAGGSMPAGMILDSDGLIHGTPTTAGAYFVNIRAQNAVGSTDIPHNGSVLAAFTVPVITTTTLPQMSQNVAYDQQIEFTGNPNPTLAVQSGTLPAGLVLETTGRLHGTPTVAAAYSFTVRATNSQGFDDQLFTGSVSAALSAPVITTTALQQPYRTVPYSQQIYATGNPAPTFALQTGTLPAGLTLSSSGLLSGIPTTTGLSNFTVRATNSQGFDDQAYTVNVLPAPNGYAVRVTLV